MMLGMSNMKRLSLVIKSCNDCPYFEYDAYYDMSRDSGYNCNKVGKRLIDEYYHKPNKCVDIPDWCPLPDDSEN